MSRKVHRFIRLAAVGALLFSSGSAVSARTPPDRAGQAVDQPILAVSAYNTPSYGREIQLVGFDGQRIRVDRHPPLPIDGAWSPDGSRIAFSGGERVVPTEGPSYGLDYRNIYTTDSRGANVRLVYAVPNADERASSYPFTPSWSPDGESLAFSVDGYGPWVVGADGRGARRIANLAIEPGQWSAWSPDGTTLAFPGVPLDEKSANEAVYTVRVDGTGFRRVTRNQTRRERAAEAGIVDVEWAPDGKRLAFVRYDLVHADQIDIVGSDGRNERRVASGGCPVWSPDGRRLAFWAEDPKGRFAGIDVVRPGKGPPRVIARTKGAWCPVWSADGHRIFFFVGARNPYVADADTGAVSKPSAAERRQVRLAPTAGQFWSTDGKLLDAEGDFDDNHYVVRVLTLHGVASTFRWSDDYSSVWSPDGQKLAFVRTQKTEQIFVLDAVGNRMRRLAAGTDPAWSPDGKWIAFDRISGRRIQIFVVPSGGGSARVIGKGLHPVWSPDSRSVAATGGGLFVMSRDGQRRRRIDRGAGESCGGGAESPSERSAWSHDGRMLAFDYWCEADQADELAVVGSDGTNQRVVAEGFSPQWSPDDTHIAFIRGDEEGALLYIPADGGTARVLEDGDVKSFSLARDGRIVAYTLDIPSNVGTEIWLVQTDGTNRRALLQGGSDSEPAWRP
jgi:Tol biopolymer transport system component